MKRFAEYLSGLLCDISNVQLNLGYDWGIRIYYDSSVFKTGRTFDENQFRGESGVFSKNYDKWKKVFLENNTGDVGKTYCKFLQIVSQIDYVELCKVTLNDEFINDGYPVSFISTNYRFFALCDTSKDVVISKNQSWHISDSIFTSQPVKYLSNFVNSDKKVLYCLFPFYKPTQFIINDPFTIIAYIFGTKPSKLNTINFDPDTILEYLKTFNIDPSNFQDRRNNNTLMSRNEYGGDEIVLSDLIFPEFSVSDTEPIPHWITKYKLLIFYCIYTAMIENNKYKTEFEKDLNNAFETLKKIISDEKNKKDRRNSKILLYNYKSLNDFLFGDNSEYKYCCLLPLYDTIKFPQLVRNYYLAFINTCSDMVNGTYNVASNESLNVKDNTFLYIVNSITKYMENLNKEITGINELNDKYIIDLTNYINVIEKYRTDFIRPKYQISQKKQPLPEEFSTIYFFDKYLEKFYAQISENTSQESLNEIIKLIEAEFDNYIGILNKLLLSTMASSTLVKNLIYALTLTNAATYNPVRSVVPMDMYVFNTYYSTEMHVNANAVFEFDHGNVVYDYFLNTINNKWLRYLNEITKFNLIPILDDQTDAVMTYPPRYYQQCIEPIFNALGGNGSSGSSGTVGILDCKNGIILDGKVLYFRPAKNTEFDTNKNFYKYLETKTITTITGGKYKKEKTSYQKYLKYKSKYLNLK